jgi:hypothetical protein
MRRCGLPKASLETRFPIRHLAHGFLESITMRREQVLARLRAHEAELRARGVQHLLLFGSAARGEEGVGSDVDLFFDQARPGFGLTDLIRVRERVVEILGQDADVMSRGSLHPVIRDEVTGSAIRVF